MSPPPWIAMAQDTLFCLYQIILRTGLFALCTYTPHFSVRKLSSLLYTTPWNGSMCHLGDKFKSLQVLKTSYKISCHLFGFFPFLPVSLSPTLASVMCLKQALGLLFQTYSLTGIPFPRYLINSHVFIHCSSLTLALRSSQLLTQYCTMTPTHPHACTPLILPLPCSLH